jgi:hypothetical protein
VVKKLDTSYSAPPEQWFQTTHRAKHNEAFSPSSTALFACSVAFGFVRGLNLDSCFAPCAAVVPICKADECDGPVKRKGKSICASPWEFSVEEAAAAERGTDCWRFVEPSELDQNFDRIRSGSSGCYQVNSTTRDFRLLATMYGSKISAVCCTRPA